MQTQSEANADSVWGHYRSGWAQYRLRLRPLQAQAEPNTDSVWGQYTLQAEANTHFRLRPIRASGWGQYRLKVRSNQVEE